MVDARAAVVAVRAVELSLALGIDLPDEMRLWRLAGGRPVAAPVPGRPEDLGLVLEANLDAADRRTSGSHYTPEHMAHGLIARALDGHAAPTVCDPACGGGALLLAAARHQIAAGAAPTDVVARLWGADLDPLAVATTEVALTLLTGTTPPDGNLVVADSLLAPPRWPPVDVVVGNPPFLSQLGAGTSRDGALATQLRERFGAALRAYTDPAALFLLAACELTREGGTVAMVQPQSVLAARDAAGVRDALSARARLRDVWLPDGRPFDAAVEVCVPILEVGARAAEDRPWSAHLAHAQGVPRVDLRVRSSFGEEATTAAAFRTEYYGTVPHVHEAASLPEGRPLLTTGLVDLAGESWGRRPARIGHRRWTSPVVDVGALEGRAADWARRTAAPKLVIATQTKVVEVTVDPEGRFLPSVPLIVAWAPTERLWPLAAALCSPPVTAWVAERTAGSALSSGALKLTAALVREVPLPPDGRAWQTGTAALQAGDLLRYADSMTAAYGCDPDVATWWLGRQ